MESLLLDTMYDLPDADDIERVVVTEEAVETGGSPTVVRRGQSEASA